MTELSPRQWEGTVAAARETSLLGTLWHLAVLAGIHGQLPTKPAQHLLGGYRLSQHNAEALRWELQILDQGLLTKLPPAIALKGAAYLLAELPNAPGRVANDLDLLFPRDQVEQAESLLFFEGWNTTHHDEYDQRYYRQWMHELPPLQHHKRGTTLDLHHNILPETFKVRTDATPLITQATSVPGSWRFKTLAPTHLVLHSVVHLFSETEWDRGLRDLYDIHTLVTHFVSQQGDSFWSKLLDEAEQLRIGWLLERAIACCQARLLTPVPNEAQQHLKAHALSKPFQAANRQLFLHGLNTRNSHTPRTDALARGLLFLRGHYLKMPLPLLTRHLFHKAFLAKEPETPQSDDRGPETHG
ncbi:nucleotidyltransferase family protein [Ectothiorhodospira sp. BSL-9]|uniref:nucleotidyltransferase domain-containing protein n=1 Tax=Ectothiorhodospira sp. BSL-9 TaxID=1442136 RepID=UPI0009EDB64B|nr:nucleotidyltransferase family protein [Ectothiorhodospira sp. BSL-9]